MRRSLLLFAVLVLVAGCKLSPEARAARTRSYWAQHSAGIAPRLAALDAAAAAAAAADDDANVVAGARPALSAQNTLLIRGGEAPRTKRAADDEAGRGFDAETPGSFIDAEMDHAVEELKALRYLAVAQPGRVVVYDLDDGALVLTRAVSDAERARAVLFAAP